MVLAKKKINKAGTLLFFSLYFGLSLSFLAGLLPTIFE